MMDILNVVLVSFISVLVLFILTKLLGNKQISQLSMFDYIIGISIGSIAAEMATELDAPQMPLTAMAVYALMAFCISLLTRKSVGFRKLATGKSILLMHGGQIYRDNLRRARFDLNDFLTLCRASGYFDLNEIQTAILEQNGTLSILPKSVSRPVTPQDLNLFPKQTPVMPSLVLDGEMQLGNLKQTGKDILWLKNQLQQLGYKNEKEVLLAVFDGERLQAYAMQPDGKPWDLFE